MNPKIGYFWTSLFLGLAVLFAPAASAQSSEDEAGDVSEVDKDRLGPLRERVRPVSGYLFLKQGRFEVSPGLGLTTRDAFYSKIMPGASLTFFPVEWLGIGLRGAYSIPLVSGSAQICRTDVQGRLAGCELPKDSDMDKIAPGKILMTGGLDLQWSPIYGKVSLFSEAFLNFDMYAIVGAAAVQYRGPRGDELTFGGNVGIGARFVLTKWLALRTELRDLIYTENFGSVTYLRNQMMIDVGLSVFLPFGFKEPKP